MARPLRAALSTLIRCLMVVLFLVVLFGLPALLISLSWAWLEQQWHNYPVWCVVIAVPSLFVVLQLIKWLMQLTAFLQIALAALVERLDR